MLISTANVATITKAVEPRKAGFRNLITMTKIMNEGRELFHSYGRDILILKNAFLESSRKASGVTHQDVKVQLCQVDAAFGLTEREELGGAGEQKLLEVGKLSLAAVPVQQRGISIGQSWRERYRVIYGMEQ